MKRFLCIVLLIAVCVLFTAAGNAHTAVCLSYAPSESNIHPPDADEFNLAPDTFELDSVISIDRAMHLQPEYDCDPEMHIPVTSQVDPDFLIDPSEKLNATFTS